MFKLWKVAVVCAVCFSASFLFTFGYRRLSSSIPKVKAAGNVAFTAHLTETIRRGPRLDGPGKIGREVIIAQRSDGARSETEVFSPGTLQERHARTITMSDLRHIKAWDMVGLKSTGAPWPVANANRYILNRPTPQSECLTNGSGQQAFPVYTLAGRETLYGLNTVKIVRQSPHLEAWHAPQLDCLEVHRLVAFRACCNGASTENSDPNGPITDSSELTLTSYSLGEPDSRLFDTASLKESAPSVATEAQLRAAHFPEDYIHSLRPEFTKLDASYWANRNAAGIRPE